MEKVLQDKADSFQLRDLLGKLPEKYKTPILLHYMEDMSYREISDTMETPIGTVMSRLARGKELLKKNILRLSRRDRAGKTVVDFSRKRGSR